MKILIKNARIVDSGSEFNKRNSDILLENGFISAIKDSIKTTKVDKVIEIENLHISSGWFDINCNIGDPGFEYKEDLESASEAAIRGGFTGLACMPSTEPAVDTKSQVEYIKNKTRGFIADIWPIGALSAGRQGKELAEMFDMKQSGAIGFSDGKRTIKDAGFLTRALLYAQGIKAPVMQYAEDSGLSKEGQMNEGPTSTSLGLKGIPSLSEEIIIARDIAIAEYTGTPIHFTTISTARSVELIREAKAKGIKVSADVSSYHLALDDSTLQTFDSNFKVKPPLRTQLDIEALKEGLIDGTIEAISSDHTPRDVEEKMREFSHASFGIINLQTSFAIANTVLSKEFNIDRILRKFTINPRRIFGLPIPVIKEGEKANLTLFDPDLEWALEEKDIRSKSKNTPFIKVKLKGKPLGVFNNKNPIK
jgi:dihydroorotase